MKTDNDLRSALFTMFDTVFGEYRKVYEFPDNPEEAFLQAYHNNNPRPNNRTLLYFHVANLDEWKSARQSSRMSNYDRNEHTATQEMMRQFDCVVDIYSKGIGVAMDAMSFLVAALRGDRWEELLQNPDWFLGKENVTAPMPIRDIENSTWTTRSRCVIKMNYRDTFTIKDNLLELAMPDEISDMETITPVVGVDVG